MSRRCFEWGMQCWNYRWTHTEKFLCEDFLSMANLRPVNDAPNARRFPYLLPNIVGASISLIGMPMVFFFLKETKHFHSSRGDGG